jgi:hypothetical protein
MANVIRFLTSGAWQANVILLTAFILAVVVAGIYRNAFVQGRAISFWPPKIGPYPRGELSMQGSNEMITPYQPLGGRAAALRAGWKGTFQQIAGPDGAPIDGPVRFSFEPKVTTVSGIWELEWHRADGTCVNLSFRLHGGFLDNRFLRLQYETNDGSALQFGSILAELSPDGSVISGRYLGYGAYSGKIIGGTIDLRRQ